MTNFNELNPMLLTDFYKTIHHLAYVPKMEYLTSYWTPRKSRYDENDIAVVFGLQGFIKEYFIKYFNEYFFNRPIEEIETEYTRIIKNTMSVQAADFTEIRKLHELGYLPIRVRAVPEGTIAKIRTPIYEFTNTVAGFGWLVNYLETYISVNVWHPINSATVAYRYRQLVNKFYDKTVCNGNKAAACGDFSMRGMTSIEGAAKSSAAHLLSFSGSATIGAIPWLEQYYNCDCEKELVGRGVPSTEHSVMSSYGREGEFECYKHLINDVFPSGPLSIVSDTYDYWNVIDNFLPKLKEDIMKRDGKIVIRGDSGDPVDIICGDFHDPRKGATARTSAEKGTVERLWEIFGGTINEKGYKVLDPHIGAIYGDAITYERAKEIYERLEMKGFAASNVTLGIGSYTYQCVTRDSLGQALKATDAFIDGKEQFIYKDPKTDHSNGNNFKKSQKGKCHVFLNENGEAIYTDEHSANEIFMDELLETVFENGHMIKETSLAEIRERLYKGEF